MSIGTIAQISGVFVVSRDGREIELKQGDTINVGDSIVGKDIDGVLEVSVEGEDNIVLNGRQTFEFDTSISESTFVNEETTFDSSAWLVANGEDTTELNQNAEDITEEETAAGNEAATSTDNGIFSFDDRLNRSVDLSTDILNGNLAQEQEIIIPIDDVNVALGETPPPSILVINLNEPIFDKEANELIYTISLSQPSTEDLQIEIFINGELRVVTIPQGQTEAIFKVENVVESREYSPHSGQVGGNVSINIPSEDVDNNKYNVEIGDVISGGEDFDIIEKPNDVSHETTIENDIVVVEAPRGIRGDSSIDLGRGDDELYVTAHTTNSDQANGAFKTEVDMGDGNNKIEIDVKGESSIGVNLSQLIMGNGSDIININTTSNGNGNRDASVGIQSTTIDTGAGNDVVEIVSKFDNQKDKSFAMKNSTINLGTGDDTLILDGRLGTFENGQNIIDGGDDYDTLFLNNTTSNNNMSFEGNADSISYSGSGDDKATINNFEEIRFGDWQKNNEGEWETNGSNTEGYNIDFSKVEAGENDSGLVIYGNNGNDIIKGTQGSDIINAGAGDDTIYGDKNDTIDGGSGYDTVMVGDGIDFDKIKNIEELDLSNGKEDTIKISVEDVLNVTDDRNELVIDGDEGDRIDLSGGDWQQGEAKDGYTYYTNEDESVKLKIQTGVEVII